MKSTIIMAGIGAFIALAYAVFIIALITPSPQWTGLNWPRGNIGNLE